MASFAPTAIDLSRVPVPAVLEALDFDALLNGYKTRFLAFWTEAQAADPSLPTFEMEEQATDPTMIVGRTWSFLRLLDRGRVNDAIKALLPTTAQGADLDNVVASRNLLRLVVRPATADAAALMESDAQLLRRYLLSFDAPASGSVGSYLFNAYSAWPGMGDGRVVEELDHGRPGDVDLVITGLDGATPEDAQRQSVADAILLKHRRKAGISPAVIKAGQSIFNPDYLIRVPGIGPSAELLRAEALERVRKAALTRSLIGAGVPDGLLKGAAYGDGSNVIEVIDRSPIIVSSDLYKVPVLGEITISTEVVS